MTGVVILVIAIVFISYAVWYESGLDDDTKFARQHRVDPPRFTRDEPRRVTDPSPQPLADYDWRAIAEGDMQR